MVEGRSAAARARAIARPRVVFWFSGIGTEAVGKWKTCFWFSTFPPPSSSKLWECGNLARLWRDSQGARGKRGKPAFGFPRFPQPRHFHSFALVLLAAEGPFKSATATTAWPSAEEVCSRASRVPALSRLFLRAEHWLPPDRRSAPAWPACRFCSLPIRASPGYRSALLSRISSLNCHPSKLINMRPNSCQVISRPSTFSCGTEPSWESSHSIFPRTTR